MIKLKTKPDETIRKQLLKHDIFAKTNSVKILELKFHIDDDNTIKNKKKYYSIDSNFNALEKAEDYSIICKDNIDNFDEFEIDNNRYYGDDKYSESIIISFDIGFSGNISAEKRILEPKDKSILEYNYKFNNDIDIIDRYIYIAFIDTKMVPMIKISYTKIDDLFRIIDIDDDDFYYTSATEKFEFSITEKINKGSGISNGILTYAAKANKIDSKVFNPEIYINEDSKIYYDASYTNGVIFQYKEVKMNLPAVDKDWESFVNIEENEDPNVTADDLMKSATDILTSLGAVITDKDRITINAFNKSKDFDSYDISFVRPDNDEENNTCIVLTAKVFENKIAVIYSTLCSSINTKNVYIVDLESKSVILNNAYNVFDNNPDYTLHYKYSDKNFIFASNNKFGIIDCIFLDNKQDIFTIYSNKSDNKSDYYTLDELRNNIKYHHAELFGLFM